MFDVVLMSGCSADTSMAGSVLAQNADSGPTGR
jgi:hypothetical protein